MERGDANCKHEVGWGALLIYLSLPQGEHSLPRCLRPSNSSPPFPPSITQRMLATLAALRRRSRATSQPRASSGSRKSTQSGGGGRASQSPSQRASVPAVAGQREAE